MRNKLGFLLLLTIVLTAIAGGWLGDRVRAGSSEDTDKLLRTFTETLAVVQKNYVREVTAQDLVESAIRGMLRTLDPHSSFFATGDYNRLQEEQQGKYHGLGISIRAEAPGSGRVVVVEPPAPGTPAYKVGLQAGDVIAKINGEPIEDWDINEEVIPNLKGPKGTAVDITVERPGDAEPLDFTVIRDEIPLYTIKFAFFVKPGVGYIRIDKFSETTGQELDQALDELSESELEGLILDLRDNPGGSLGAAIDVADRFLRRGELVVSTRIRGGVPDHSYSAENGRKYNYPMVVLINENSASASEIVAGALQDHERALVVGETSFGKALVQTIFPLEGRRGLALTTGKYYTPDNRLIQRDYSEGFYDYFYNRRQASDRSSAGTAKPGEHRGGIEPDEIVEQDTAPRLVRQLDGRNLFYKFSTKLASGEIVSDVLYERSRVERAELSPEGRRKLMDELVISNQTLEHFRQFLTDQEKPVRLLDEFDNQREILRNRLRQQLFIQIFGEAAGHQIALELDRQLEKAVEMIPRAKELAENQSKASSTN